MNKQLVIVGLVLFLTGAYISVPYLVGHFRYNTVHGELRDVYSDPIGDDRYRIVFHFDFPIEEGGADGAIVRGLGIGTCDAFGNEVAAEVVSGRDVPAVLEGYESLKDHRHIVYYRPENPLESARICFQSGSIIGFDLGVLLMIAPILVWVGMFLAAVSYRRSMRQA